MNIFDVYVGNVYRVNDDCNNCFIRRTLLLKRKNYYYDLYRKNKYKISTDNLNFNDIFVDEDNNLTSFIDFVNNDKKLQMSLILRPNVYPRRIVNIHRDMMKVKNKVMNK